jgi:hypothetical protein
MPKSRSTLWFLVVWIASLAFYAALSHHMGRSLPLDTFGNIVQCFVPLLANGGLLINAGTAHWRRNLFWMLLALSCSMWMLGQFQWTYYEVYLHKDVPGLFAGDIIFFLRGIPLMAALALQPHRKQGERSVFFGKYCRNSPFVFSFEPRCQGLCGSQKYTFTSVATVKLLCLAISSPRSQVKERRRAAGSLRTCRVSAATTTAVSLPETFTGAVKREWRSTKVAM